jgi:hypothetical protein
MQVQTEEEEMQTTSHLTRVVATLAVLVLGALTLGVSAGMAAQHEPKVGLGYPSEAAAHAIHGVRVVQIDARHMSLVDNARRHGLNVQGVKPSGSSLDASTPATSAKLTGSVSGRGGFGWTYPGVLAGLSLAFALIAGGIVLVARRVKSRAVTA